MKIIIIGTSNSVMGVRGYIKALQIENEVKYFSLGRCNFYHHINVVLQNRELIESSDLLIIDHYVNDVQSYYLRLEHDYEKLLSDFYSLLSTLNVHLLNVLFPIQNLSKFYGFAAYDIVKNLSRKHKISILDLNEYNIDDSCFQDRIHLSHDYSFSFGVILNKALSFFSVDEKPVGGLMIESPYSSKQISSLINEPAIKFKNNIVEKDYISIKSNIFIASKPSRQLVSLGYVMPNNYEGEMGIEINDKKFCFLGYGVFHEMLGFNVTGDITIKPLLGEYNNIPVLLDKKPAVSGFFSKCYLNDLLFYDKNKLLEGRAASRNFVNLVLDGFSKIC